MFNFNFNPYSTEVHRKYVPVAGHGAWLAVLLAILLEITRRGIILRIKETICMKLQAIFSGLT